MPMRIQVIFGETSLLVPCGDGKLTVAELIEKSVTRFKKVITKHPEDVIEVRSLRLADSGSFVDEDDEVADVLEDKETVILDYEYYPHVHQDTNSLRDVSISDDSAIVGTSSQPFSPGNLDNNVDHTHFTSDGPVHPQLSDKDYEEEGVAMGVADNLPSERGSQEDREEEQVTPPHQTSQDLHSLEEEASQDQEILSNQNWHSLTASSSQESPHLNRKAPTWRTSTGAAGRDIVLDSQDSGYAPTKSQDSYGHPKSQESYGPSKSQEAFPTDLSFHQSPSSQGQTDNSIHAPRVDYSVTTATGARLSSEGTGSQTNLTRGSKGRSGGKEENQQKSGFDSPAGSKTSLFKPQDSRYGHQKFPRSESHDPTHRGRTDPFPTPPRDYHRGGMDIPGHFGRPGSYAGYPNSYSDNRSHTLPHTVDESGYHDHGLRPLDQWRRSFHTANDYAHYHDMYAGGGQRYGDFQNDQFHYQGGSGRFNRPHDGHFPGNRRGDFRTSRTLSHERLDQVPPYGGGVGGRPFNYGGRPGIEEDQNAPVDYFLSQPNPSYVNYDRPGSFAGGPPGHIPSYDHRFAMSGPSGVSLSQPGVMLSHGGGRGMYDYDRRGGPWGPGDQRGGGRMRGGGVARESGRGYTLDEEFDHLDEEDEMEEGSGAKGRGRPSPFQRDFRKSMFRDGPLYSQWMERIHEYGIQEIEEVKQKRQEEWERVRKPEDPLERPEVSVIDNRTLYERLKEQKDRKQEEWEDQYKFKNMIYKGLDDDESGFLTFVSQRKAEHDAKVIRSEIDEVTAYREAVSRLHEDVQAPSTITQSESSEKSEGEEKTERKTTDFGQTKLKPSKPKSQLSLIAGSIKTKRKRNSSEASDSKECSPEKKIKLSPSVKEDRPPRTSENSEIGALSGLAAYSSSESDED